MTGGGALVRTGLSQVAHMASRRFEVGNVIDNPQRGLRPQSA